VTSTFTPRLGYAFIRQSGRHRQRNTDIYRLDLDNLKMYLIT